MDTLTHSESIVIGCSAQTLYDMVADVTRIGEWSPVCRTCWWDEGDGPRVGAWFTGRNELPERTWETRSEVVVADRGREFAFVVGGTFARWGYTFTPMGEETESRPDLRCASIQPCRSIGWWHRHCPNTPT